MAAGEPTLKIDVTVDADGTGPWDSTPGPGNDAETTPGAGNAGRNGVVRVNDTVTYAVAYAVNDAPGTNVRLKVAFPRGLEITALPGFCVRPQSEILPATAGTPALPLTANSWQSLSPQTLTCHLGNMQHAAETVKFVTKVSSLLPNDHVIALAAAEIAADNAASPTAAQTLPTVTATARLKWDVSKNGIAQTEDSGYVYGPMNVACAWDSTKVCLQTVYQLLISAPVGGKGAMPAIGDITLVDDLRPEAMYPDLPPDKIAEINAQIDTYGSRLAGNATYYMAPGPRIGGAAVENITTTPVNSVRDSGTVVQQQAAPGTPITFKISGADTSLRTYPTEALRPANTALPANVAYAVSHAFAVHTPAITIEEFGTKSGDSLTWTLKTFNAFSELSIKGFDPTTDVQTSADQPGPNAVKPPGDPYGVHWNDYRVTTPQVALVGAFTKRFAGVPGAAGNMTPVQFSPSSADVGEGPPGGATVRSGGITVASTQTVTSQMSFRGSTPAKPAPISFIGCDAWDPTQLNLSNTNGVSPWVNSGSTGALQRIPADGRNVWVSGYNNAPGGYASTAAEAPSITVEYSAKPALASGSETCDDGQGPWFDSPENPAFNNDPGLAATGVYSGVARVRVFLVLPVPATSHSSVGAGVAAVVSLGLKVVDSGEPTGTILRNLGNAKHMIDQNLTPEEMLAAPEAWSSEAYDPQVHVGPGGDRLTLVDAQARVNKQVRKGDSGPFGSTPPNVTGGDFVDYQLSPSLTSGAATPGVVREMWVEDCLPHSQAYHHASVTPDVVLPGSTPADAKRPVCPSQDTYIRWVLPSQEVNVPIAPIILTVQVLSTAADDSYSNTVVVWAQGDSSTLLARQDDAQVQIANVAGVKLEKVALTPVVQVNRAGQAIKQHNEWSVRLTNTFPAGSGTNPTTPDIIDVLPRDGVSGSSFAGTFSLVDADVTAGAPEAKILYTRVASVELDPQDPSNGAAGSTTWCDAPSGGTAVLGTGACPTGLDDVTALRVRSSDALIPGEEIAFKVTMVGTDNEAGDTYVNRTFARAEGLTYPVGPIARSEIAVGSSLGDRAWWDLDRDGLQGQYAGAPEPAAAGVTVTLSGRDGLGNTVNVSDTTDANGEYSFERLRSSDASGYVLTFGRPDTFAGFTRLGGSPDDPALDSNVIPATGKTAGVVLAANTDNSSVDAGYLADGSLVVTKVLTGVGAGTLAEGDVIAFDVNCTFNGTSVLDDEFTLTVTAGALRLNSATFEDLPVGSVCVIEETDGGNSDVSDPLPSATVTIVWDAEAQAGGRVVATLSNAYSAGSVEVTKVLEGDPAAVAAASNTTFKVLVTCQVPGTDAGAPLTVHSSAVSLKGGETVKVRGGDGNPVVLPKGARCFGEEIDTGGAVGAVVDHHDYDSAVVVDPSDPNTLVVVELTATNTFRNPAALAMTKTLDVMQTLDAASGTYKVSYTVEVRNNGSLSTTYDLDDRLKFGGGIQITEAGVDSVDPATLVVNPDFNGQSQPRIVTGQSIAGGAVHQFVVGVEATVTDEATTASANCVIGGSESGSGFLNQAVVSWSGVPLEDDACAEPPLPDGPSPSPSPSVNPSPSPSPSPSVNPSPSASPSKTPSVSPTFVGNTPGPAPGSSWGDPQSGDGLPDAGGPALWIVIAAGLMVLLGGFFLRSRRDAEAE